MSFKIAKVTLLKIETDTASQCNLLTVRCWDNIPEVGQHIYLPENKGYEIKNIESLEDNLCVLRMSYVTHYQLNENDNMACGLSPKDFHTLLKGQEKLDYITQIVEFLAVGRVKGFLKKNVRLANILVPDSPPSPELPSEEEMIEAFSKLPISKEEKEVMIARNLSLRSFFTSQEDDKVFPKISFSNLSKIGGLPIASPDFVFPTNADGLSCIFLAQIHLAELKQYFDAPKELNGNGILYFFATIRNDIEADFSHFAEIKAVYASQTDNLVQHALPADLQGFGALKESSLRVAEIVDFPYIESALWEIDARTKDENDNFWHIMEMLQTFQNYQGAKFLGQAYQMQNCVLIEAEMYVTKTGYFSNEKLPHEKILEDMNNAAPNAIRWRHLFEINVFNTDFWSELTQYQGNFNEYLSGRFYLMIPQTDLEAMNFDNTVTIYQCT